MPAETFVSKPFFWSRQLFVSKNVFLRAGHGRVSGSATATGSATFPAPPQPRPLAPHATDMRCAF